MPADIRTSLVKTLSEVGPEALRLAGGKGANLGALIAAGFPVPPGFCLTTGAYRAFVSANGLQPAILRLAEGARVADGASLDSASAQIRALFAASRLPAELAAEIEAAYAALGRPPAAVAVRSSATAEDLPDMSFAGQHDTYLNIVGVPALLEAVKRCWASLWTARALGYRARYEVPSDELALAVVVQQMVPSEASGVLFTANPLTGKRMETVIDATLGLGEALVSGQVEPDHYVVDTAAGRILEKRLGAKAIAIRALSAGGTVTEAATAGNRQALPDAQILELARLGRRAAQVFGAPQDMEWAWARGSLAIVQSRPITSLFPLPAAWPTDDALRVWFSFGVWQGMLDPYTPLGQDMLAGLVASVSRRLGSPQTIASQRVIVTAAERMYVDITPILRNVIGRNVLTVFVSEIDPASAGPLKVLTQDPRLAVQGGRPKLSLLWRLAPAVAPLLANVVFNLINPAEGRERAQRIIERGLKAFSWRPVGPEALGDWLSTLEITVDRLPSVWLPTLLAAVISGQVAFQNLLRLAAASLPNGEALALELTRGLPHNVTTEMDLALWRTAIALQADAASRDRVARAEAAELARDYQSGKLPPAAQTAVGDFLKRYGARGVGEIDIGRARWREDPTHIFQVLQSYLRLKATDGSPEAVFQRGAANAEAAGRQLVEASRQTGGWLRARLVAWLISRVRALAGLRETPKFAVVRLLDVVRQGLLICGQELAAGGLLRQADDLFYLHLDELQNFAIGTGAAGEPDSLGLIAERRQTYARERRRRQLPRLLLSDGTAFYETTPATGAAEGVLLGTPVSAGVVEGEAHVILDPRNAQLAPGEILVCPATDPAWTPLFLAAGGLVMEVGGMMTHGSVVAREYGIPAVVGVPQATTRLRTGQRLRVDGSTGRVAILEAAGGAAAG
jgi:phosphohistidine swiveling domain-containing protein